MKKATTALFGFILCIVFIISCKTSGTEPDIPVYSYTEPIVNPPDVFNIVFNIAQYGDRIVEVTFEQDAVWKIEKLGDGKVNLYVASASNQISILSKDTIGLQSDSVYYVVVNNNNYTGFNNYFVGFTKVDLDYANFEPKL
jgi:hypothetical protein